MTEPIALPVQRHPRQTLHHVWAPKLGRALMFTSLGSLFNGISDPAMGGAYLTLLNTIAK